MRCADYKRWLSPYVDAQLPEAQRRQLDEHLQGCTTCRSDLASLQEMLRSLQTMDAPQSPDLLPGIHKKLSRTPTWRLALEQVFAWRPTQMPWHQLALATTALLVVVVGSQVYVKRGMEGARRAASALPLKRAETPQWRGLAGNLEQDTMKVNETMPLDESADKSAAFQQPASAPLQAQWNVADVAAATVQVSEWVKSKGGAIVTTDGRHLSIQLPSSELPQFLLRFTTNPANDGLAQEPFRVTIHLELIPSDK